MKLKYTYPALLAASLAVTSCENKEKPAAEKNSGEDKTALVEDAKKEVQKESQEVKEAVTPDAPADVSAEKRVAKLGFVKYLPADTEGIFAFYRGAELVKAMRGSSFGKFVEKTMAEQGTTLDEMANSDPQSKMFLDALSEETFVAIGDGGGQQGENGLKLMNAMNYGNMKMMVSMVAKNLKGETDPNMMMQSEMMGMMSGILEDPNAGIDLIEKLETAPLTIGIKVSDQDQREQIAGMIKGGLQQMLQGGDEVPAEAFDLEKNGFKLSGVKILGEKLAAMMDADTRMNMSQMLGGEANVDRLVKAIEKRNLIISSAVKDEYVIVSLAGSEDDIKFAATAGDSVASSEEFDFIDDYRDKDLNLLAFGNKEALGHLLSQKAGGLNAYADGIMAGLKDTDAFGDTTDIETLLDHVKKVGGEYYDLYRPETLGSVGYLEDGFKIETFGGTNQPAIDFGKTHELAPLGEGDDVFFFADWTNNPEAAELGLELLDSMGEAAYTMAKQAARLDVQDPGFQDFAESFGMFDRIFAKDMREVWGALRGDFAAGVGSENALVVDLKGGLPKVPGVPAPFLKDGKMPRITFAAPVEDREKLAQSWERLNGALTNILKQVSEMAGTEIPMQEPISSGNGDQTSWFFTTIPFTTNDFMPNITVSDQYFFASTSKNLAGGLEETIKAGGGPERNGFYMETDFQTLQKYAQDWLTRAKENKETLFKENPSGLKDFEANLPKIEEALDSLQNLDKMTYHLREVDGESRSSFHFKTK